ncbi:DNA translocase FtsK [Aciduricibacillus chroicocephali]|uniref:DNA translocase FtsK n=1 Tax=Aciduricibacillus chroicocephali TaxID=3054939 RepID=A0ABY9KYK6_9BACI|nr:DNA translocase FtsK [Bacillaceae bacterium 44XB]
MAKKRKKRKSQLKDQVRFELIGLLLIAIAIFGSGASLISDGLIPRSLEYIFRFVFGIWYFVASIYLLATGFYIMAKRKRPDFLNKKLIGFYISFGGILMLTHIQTFDRLLVAGNDVSILKATWHYFMAYVQGVGTASQTGGGMAGGLLFAFFSYLFSVAGAKILSILTILAGIVFITEFSIGDFFAKIMDKTFESMKTAKKNRAEKREKRRAEKELQLQLAAEQAEAELNEMVFAEEPSEDEETKEEDVHINYASDVLPVKNKNQSEHVQVPDDKQAKHQEDSAFDQQLAQSLAVHENHDYRLPSFKLLKEPVPNTQNKEKSHIQATVRKLEKTFQSFGVKAKVTKVHVGPAVTKYEIYPEAGVKVSKIVSLHDDLALALAAKDIRIEAPIPGKSAVGIEVPNQEIAMVSLREVLENQANPAKKLLFALGRDISGDAVAGELNKMPHLLIAGATGSGKSVCVNGIIVSILMRAKPHEVKMMMIDPKKVELNVYNGIPHLLAPVVTDPKKASQALKKVVAEMERRYELFSDTGTRNIEGYNDHVRRHNEEHNSDQPHLPYIVVLVDELADLMMVASNDVEDAITRLAQMARAAGIHLIIATQRPSVDVITGVIKANIPSRIAFSVSSQTDSRTILDSGGAEKLLGRGDMLYMPVGTSKPTRVQGAFLSDEEVEKIVNHCVEQQKAVYQENMIPDETNEVADDVDDELYEDAVKMIVEMQSASVSMLQRRFRIGYTRAARLIDAMEDRGIVGPYEGSKPRTVLVSEMMDEVNS